MEDIRIYKTTSDHIDQLRKIGRQTFSETFASMNTPDNMDQYLNDRFSPERLAAELKNPHSEFYLAELHGETVGYLKVNGGPAQTEIRDDKGFEIERIYVLKAFHGKKVAQLLYAKAIECAKEKDADYVWLGVWEENARAIAFYTKNGFVPFDKHIFRLGNDEQTDIMMKLILKEN